MQKNSRDSDCRKFWKLEGKGSELSGRAEKEGIEQQEISKKEVFEITIKGGGRREKRAKDDASTFE